MKSIKLIVAALLFVCVQVAFAQSYCYGTVYFKAPDGWTGAYIGESLDTTLKSMRLNRRGYYEFDLGSWNARYSDRVYFAIGNAPTVEGTSKIVTRTNYNTEPETVSWPTYEANIPCPNEDSVVYVTENPKNPGRTYMGKYPPDAKFFYVLVPEGLEWQSDELVISYTAPGGTNKDTVLAPLDDMCGWVHMVFETVPSDVVIYLKNNPDVQLGVNGLWDDDGIADPIDLSVLYDFFGSNQLYFIPQKNMWPDEDSQGWYDKDPGVDGVCSFMLAGLIYDTDKSLNLLFTEDATDRTGYGSCVGIHQGMVMPDLGADNKPVYNSSGAWSKTCFGNETNFKTLFNYTPNVNEVQCYDMPFRHYGTDTRWSFNSNYMVTDGLVGGFYPLENSTDASVVEMDGVKMGPLPAARNKRIAEGPPAILADSILGMPLDYYCKTPGWPVGKDCEGLFANGDEAVIGQIWCWGDYCKPGFSRWGTNSKTVSRNQHYCMEMHATFTYRESDEFTIIGDDDIWVFINKKIAVDNGGAHLPAPGHVVLKNLNTTYGAGFLVPGNDYNLDIFFCDRRTTMSNLTIKTNMSLIKYSGMHIDITPQTVESGERLDICVERSGGGDCASVVLGSSDQPYRKCGDEIDEAITYSITSRKGLVPMNCGGYDCTALPYGPTAGPLANGVVLGGINLANPRVPIVNQEKIYGLTPGNYKLAIEIDGKRAYYDFSIAGEPEEDSNSSTETSSSSGKVSSSNSGKVSSSSNAKTSSSSGSVKSSSSFADEDFAMPSFRIKMTGPFEFAIVLDESAANSKKSFAVMDLQGGVLQEGVIESAETHVPVLSKGSYIVKVGLGYRRVNVH